MTLILSRMLRHPTDPDQRLRAARALGEQDDLEAAPLLIRAVVEDPDAQVRAAALDSLRNLIGAESDLAVRTYRAQPDDDPWLVDLDPDGEDEIQEAGLSFEDDQELSGLVSVLRNHPDARMRLKAVHLLANTSDLRVIAALAETVLWTDDADVRQAAYQSLQQRFGEETDDIIRTYQVYEEDDLPEEAETDDWNLAEDSYNPDEDTTDAGDDQRWQAPVSSPVTASQVVHEEGFPWLLAAAAAAGLLLVVVLILLLT